LARLVRAAQEWLWDRAMFFGDALRITCASAPINHCVAEALRSEFFAIN
jgi:hypothetical protein